MSYLVLARKYRPRSFDAMVGQEHVVQALSNALTQQRLHHAYLFTGTRGVGKTTVSRILAKSLNCTGADGQGGITAQPCGVCDACRDIDAGRFVDYVELDAASNRGVDEISQLLDQAVYKPVLGRFKVYMIDEVHMLSTTAFNAMLKTLEEPPDYLKFVLATTDPQKVPPTVLSRCLQFNLRPMAPQTVQEHLGAVLAEEGIVAEPGALRLLARAARGSMRDALSLTDQAIAFGAGALAESGVRRMLGAVDRGHAERLVEALAAGDGSAVIAAVDGLRSLGLAAAGTLEEMASLLQQMAVQQAVPGALDANDPDTPAVEKLARALPPDETQLLYSIVVHGRAELALAPDEYSGLVMVLLRMLAFRPAGSGAAEPAAPRPAPTPATRAPVARAPVARAPEPPPWLDAPDELDVETPTPLAAPTPMPRAELPSVASTPLGDRWAAQVRSLCDGGSIGALVRELAMQSQCVAVDEMATPARWTLRVERETLRSPANVDKLQAALAQSLGRPVKLHVEAGAAEDSPARRDAAERARRQAEAEQIIHDDPLVQALMAQYKTARIVPGSVKPH
ncbi:DNA polymerase III subunit gamma/tau [uncultured Piscinibacter sp.]|uniref:DNA polymerase III subunit gamma/tau n=1 Tax=uncultured Piscinibacter sp. TaxID=1131835 RepID=UPI0026115FBA|nr:DNA polymerase III subunit gamma/tau [uncultured Piscinibacter sp.]